MKEFKTIQNPWLIQRGTFKDIEEKDIVGLDSLMSYDYMGSSEFEFGALHYSLKRMASSWSEYEWFPVDEIKDNNGDALYVLCRKRQRDEVIEVVKALSEKEDYSTKERVQLNDYLSCRFKHDVNFWWDITSEDTFGAKDPLIEIEMSPTQFAEVITSLNQGSGTPVTIRKIWSENKYEKFPDPPYQNERDLFDKEFKEDVKNIMSHTETMIENALKVLNQKSITKTALKEVIGGLSKLKTDIYANMPFVAKSFNEHMEKSVSSAKIEIETYIDSKIHAAGLEALKNNVPQSNLLEDKKGDTE